MGAPQNNIIGARHLLRKVRKHRKEKAIPQHKPIVLPTPARGLEIRRIHLTRLPNPINRVCAPTPDPLHDVAPACLQHARRPTLTTENAEQYRLTNSLPRICAASYPKTPPRSTPQYASHASRDSDPLEAGAAFLSTLLVKRVGYVRCARGSRAKKQRVDEMLRRK